MTVLDNNLLPTKEPKNSVLGKIAKSSVTHPVYDPYGPTDLGQSQYDSQLNELTIGSLNEERALKQSTADKFVNDVLKGIGTAGSSFLSTAGILTFGVANVLTGNFSGLWNNPVSNAMATFNDEMEAVLPNYYTEEERLSANPFKGIVPFTTGSANFWFDKILKNAGFTVGSIGASMALNKILGLGSKAIALNQKAVALQALEGDVTGALIKAKAFKYSDINTLMVGVGAGAMGQAGVEAIHNYRYFKETLTNKWYNENPGLKMPPEVMDNIESTAKGSANYAFLINTVLLSWSDWVLIGKLFGGKTVANNVLRSTTTKEGIGLIVDPVKRLERFGSIGKAFAAESFEEGTQYGIEKGTQDYYLRKFDNPSISWADNMLKSVATGMEESVGTKEGLENWIIGGISGSLFGTVLNRVTGKSWLDRSADEQFAFTKAAVDVINPYLTGDKKMATLFEGTIRGKAIQDQLNLANERDDVFEFQNLKAEELMNVASAAIKLGKFDMLMDKIEDVGYMKEEDFKTSFGLDYDGNEKSITQYIDKVRRQLLHVKKISDLVENKYSDADQILKDNLIWTSFGIDNVDAREEDLSTKISNISNGKVAYNLTRKMWDTPGERAAFEEDFKSQIDEFKKESPSKYDIITPFLDDIKKLRKRREAFIEAYNALTKADATAVLRNKLQRIIDEAEKKFTQRNTPVQEKVASEWDGVEVTYDYAHPKDKTLVGEVKGVVRRNSSGKYEFFPNSGSSVRAIVDFEPSRVISKVSKEDREKQTFLDTRIEVLTKLIAEIKDAVLNYKRPKRVENRKKIEEIKTELGVKVKDLNEAIAKLDTQSKVKVVDAEGKERFKKSKAEIEEIIEELNTRYSTMIDELMDTIEALELSEKSLIELGSIYNERLKLLNQTRDPKSFEELIGEIEEIKKERTIVGQLLQIAREALDKVMALFQQMVSKLSNLNKKNTLDAKAEVQEYQDGVKELEAEFKTLEIKQAGFALEIRRLEETLERKRVAKRKAKKDKGRPNAGNDNTAPPEPTSTDDDRYYEAPKRDVVTVPWGSAGNDGGIAQTPEQERWYAYTEKINLSESIYSVRAVSKNHIPEELKGKLNFDSEDVILYVLYKDGVLVEVEGLPVYTTMFTSERILKTEGYSKATEELHTNKSEYTDEKLEEMAEQHEKLRQEIFNGATVYFAVNGKSRGFLQKGEKSTILNRIIDSEEQIPEVKIIIKKREDKETLDIGGVAYTAKPGMVFIEYQGQVVPIHLSKLGDIENGVETVMALIHGYLTAKDAKEASIYRFKLKGIINWGRSIHEQEEDRLFEMYISDTRQEIVFGGIVYDANNYNKDRLIDLLKDKFINVNELKLKDNKEYTDPISGKKFKTYKHYLLSGFAEGEPRPLSQVPIKVSIVPKTERQFRGVYLTFAPKTFNAPVTSFSVKKPSAPVEKPSTVAGTKVTVAVPVTEVRETFEDRVRSIPSLQEGDSFTLLQQANATLQVEYEYIVTKDGYKLERVVKRTQTSLEAIDLLKTLPPPVVAMNDIVNSHFKTTVSEEVLEHIKKAGFSKVTIKKKEAPIAANPFEGQGFVDESGKEIDTTKTEEAKPDDLDKESPFKLFTGEEALGDKERAAEIERAKALLPESLRSRFETIIGLIENKAIGRLTQDGRVLLSTLMSAGTAYHEAFHSVTHLLLSRQERSALYDAWREENSSNLSDTEVEEKLAEAFEDFMLENPPKVENFIQRIFRQIIDFLKWITGNYVKETSTQRLFNKIARGGFRKAPILQYAERNVDKPYIDTKGNQNPEVFTNALMEGMTYHFFKFLFDSHENIPIDTVFDLSEEAVNKIKDLYQKTLDALKADIMAAKGSSTDEAVNLKKKQTFIAWIEREYKTLIAHHGDFLNKFGLVVTLNDEDSYDEENRVGNEYSNYVESIKFSQKKGASAYLRLLLASLPKMRNNEGTFEIVKHPVYQIPQLTDIGTTFNILQSSLAGVYDFESKMVLVQGLVSYRPEYSVLLERLGVSINGTIGSSLNTITTINMSDEKVALQCQFNQQFAKSNINYKINLMTNTANYEINANANNNLNRIIAKWKQEGRRGFGTPENLYKIGPEGDLVFNVEKFKAVKYPGVNGPEPLKLTDLDHVIYFLSRLGINFSSDTFIAKDLAPLKDLVNAINLYALKDNKRNIFDDGLIGGALKGAAMIESRMNPASQELQFINAEGETVYEITMNDYLSLIVDGINNDGVNIFEHLENPYTNNSVWKKIILRDKNALGRILLGGVQLRQEDSEGVITSNLKHGDYLLYMLQNVLTWKFPLLRASDRKLEKGFEIKFEAEADNYLKTFLGYLEDELVAIENNKRGVGRDVQFYKNNRKGLGIMSFIPESLVSGREIEAVLADPNVHKAIEDYIFTQTKANLDEFVKYRVFDKFGKNYRNNGLDHDILRKILDTKNVLSIEDTSLEGIIKTFTVRSLIANIEQTKLIIGDVTQYKNLGDISKRIGGALGTKKVCRNDVHFNNWINARWNREDKPDMNGDFRVSALKDHMVYSPEFILAAKRISEAFGLNLPESHYDDYGIDQKNKEGKINETDAQGYITLQEYKEFFMRMGEWNPSLESVYQRALRGDVSSDIIQMLPPIKPQYFGPKYQSKMFSLFFMKCSLIPLIPSMIAGTPLETLNDRMLKNGVGYAVYESGIKVGAKQPNSGFQSIYDDKGEPNTEESMDYDTLNYKFFGVQVDITAKRKDRELRVIFGTQFRKLILSNLMEAGQGKPFRVWDKKEGKYVEKPSNELVEEWVALNKQMVDTSVDELFREITLEETEDKSGYRIRNISALRKKLVNALEERDVPLNDIDAVRNALSDESNLRLLDLAANKDRLESVLYAIVNNSLIKQKVKGESLIQGSSAGFNIKARKWEYLNEDTKKNIVWLANQERLKFYDYSDKGEITRMQILLPHYFQQYYDGQGIESIPKELLNLIGYRIPTQGLNSIESMEVAGFLPETAGNLIIVPSEITTKTGSDFDVDKLNVFFPYFEKSEMGMHRISSELSYIEGLKKKIAASKYILESQDNNSQEYKDAEKEIGISRGLLKKATHNRMMDLAHEILTSPDNFEEFTRANSSKILSGLAKEIRIAKNISQPTELNKLIEFVYNSSIARDFWVSKDALGIAARHNTFHTLAAIAGLEVADANTTLNFKYYNKTENGNIALGYRKDAKGENDISELLSEFINAYVDVVKENFVNTLNAGTQTSGVWMYLLHAGVPVRDIAFFMNQPIIVDYIKAQEINESIFFETKATKINKYKDDLIASVKQEFMTKMGVRPKEYVGEKYSATALKKMLEESYIKNNVAAVSMQLQILTDFLNYQEQSKTFGDVLHATTQDTKGAGKSRWEARLIHKKYTDVVNAGKFKNLGKVISMMNLDEPSTRLLQPFYNTVAKSKDYFNSLFAADNPSIEGPLVELFKIFSNPELGLKTDDILKNMRYAENDLITYILTNGNMNTFKINEHIKRLTQGSNSMAVRLQNLVNVAPADKKVSLQNNLIFKEFLPVIKDNRTGEDSDIISMNSRRLDKYDSDALIISMRELRDLYGPEVTAFYNDLVWLSILQSGLDNSPVSIKNAIPEEDYRRIAYNTIEDAINTDSLNLDTETGKASFINSFFRNNYWRSTLVPRFDGQYVTGSYDTRKTVRVKYNPDTQELVGLKESSDRAQKNLEFPYIIVRYVPEDMTVEQREDLIKRGRSPKTEFHLYKQVPNLVDATKKAWIRVGLLSNRWDLKELYDSWNIPSVIVSNNVKRDTKVTPKPDKLFSSSTTTEALAFSTETLNKINGVLEAIGVNQRLVRSFKDSNGNIIEDVVAAANFIEGTVDIIEDLDRRPSAWNSLPEETAHWWYRLLEHNHPLKKQLWEIAAGSELFKELRAENYGGYSKEEDLIEETIGKLIAKAIHNLETKPVESVKLERSLLKRIWDYIKQVVFGYKSAKSLEEPSSNKEDAFDIAAKRILNKEIEDLYSLEFYNKIVSRLSDKEIFEIVETVDTEEGVRDSVDLSSVVIVKGFNAIGFSSLNHFRKNPTETQIFLNKRSDNNPTSTYLSSILKSYYNWGNVSSKAELLDLLRELELTLNLSQYQSTKRAIQKSISESFDRISEYNALEHALVRLYSEGHFDENLKKLALSRKLKDNSYPKSQYLKDYSEIVRERLSGLGLSDSIIGTYLSSIAKNKVFNKNYHIKIEIPQSLNFLKIGELIRIKQEKFSLVNNYRSANKQLTPEAIHDLFTVRQLLKKAVKLPEDSIREKIEAPYAKLQEFIQKNFEKVDLVTFSNLGMALKVKDINKHPNISNDRILNIVYNITDYSPKLRELQHELGEGVFYKVLIDKLKEDGIYAKFIEDYKELLEVVKFDKNNALSMSTLKDISLQDLKEMLFMKLALTSNSLIEHLEYLLNLNSKQSLIAYWIKQMTPDNYAKYLVKRDKIKNKYLGIDVPVDRQITYFNLVDLGQKLKDVIQPISLAYGRAYKKLGEYLQYDPNDAYKRGFNFYHGIPGYSSTSIDLESIEYLVNNLKWFTENNFEFLLSTYTASAKGNEKSTKLGGRVQPIRIVLLPKSEDIKLCSHTDAYSGQAQFLTLEEMSFKIPINKVIASDISKVSRSVQESILKRHHNHNEQVINLRKGHFYFEWEDWLNEDIKDYLISINRELVPNLKVSPTIVDINSSYKDDSPFVNGKFKGSTEEIAQLKENNKQFLKEEPIMPHELKSLFNQFLEEAKKQIEESNLQNPFEESQELANQLFNYIKDFSKFSESTSYYGLKVNNIQSTVFARDQHKIIDLIDFLVNYNTMEDFKLEDLEQLNSYKAPEERTSFLYSVKKTASNPIQASIVSKLEDADSRILYDPKKVNKDKDKKRSGYSLVNKLTGAIKEIVNRVTDKIDAIDAKRNFTERTPAEKITDEVKRDSGFRVHSALNNIAKIFIEGLNGNSVTQRDTFGLSDNMYKQLEFQFKNIIKQLPPDTKWFSELRVYDLKNDMAGTIDLIAVDAKGKVHIFDFKSIDLFGKSEIPKYKKENWNVQITTYKRILENNYGIKNFGMLRAIPIQTTYKYVDKKLVLSGIKVANARLELEKDERLLPIPLTGLLSGDVELTGDDKTDALIQRLLGQLDRITKKTEYEDQAKIKKTERILELQKAIRNLQVLGDINAFIDSASYEVARLEKEDFDKMSIEDLINADKLLEFYSTLYSEGVIPDSQKEKYADSRLNKMILVSQNVLNDVRAAAKKRVLELGTMEGNPDILSATPESSLWSRLLRSASQSQHPIINTLYKLVMKQRDKTRASIEGIRAKLTTLDEDLQKWANDRGLKGLDVYKHLLKYNAKGEWTGKLIDKFSPEWWDAKKKAIESKDYDFIMANTTFEEENFEKRVVDSTKYWNEVFKGRANAQEEVDKRVLNLRKQYDVKKYKSALLNKNNYYLKPLEKWESKETQFMKKNPPLLAYYNYYTELMRDYHKFLEFDFKGNFVPNIENNLLQQIYDVGFNAAVGLNLKHNFDAKSDGMIGFIDERGQISHKIPMFFTTPIDPKIKSRDLTKTMLIFSEMALNNKHMQEIESAALLLQDAMESHPSLITDGSGKPKRDSITKKLAEKANSATDIDQFNNYLLDYVYGVKTDGKDYVFDNGVSGKKVFSGLMSTFSVTKLALNIFTAFANGVGGTANGFFEGARGRFYNNVQFSNAIIRLASRDKASVTLMEYFDINSNETVYKKAQRMSAEAVLRTFTFDKFHALQRGGDYVVENSVLLAMVDSHTIRNGKIVKKKEGEKSLHELTSENGFNPTVLGITELEYGKFRRKVKYLYSTLKGNNNPDDITQVRRTVFGQALMHFRSWIPRMADERLGELRYTNDLDMWEEGKFRTFFSHIINKNIVPNVVSFLGANGILGLGKNTFDESFNKQADAEWERMVTKNPLLKITKEEYREVYKGNIRATLAELQTVLAFMVLLALSKPSGGDDGKDPQRRLFLRLTKRTIQELSFWTSPTSFQNILKTPIPVVGIVDDALNLLVSTGKAGYYKTIGDDKEYDKVYAMRDFFKLFPIASSAEGVYSTISPRKK